MRKRFKYTTSTVLMMIGLTWSISISLAADATLTTAEETSVADAAEVVSDESALVYCVVVSTQTNADPAWHAVVEALSAKHADAKQVGGSKIVQTVTFEKNVGESLESLRSFSPTWCCFVATPEEANGEFVAQVHRLTRQLDADPYTDCYWGILTGYDSESAMRIARCAEPLVIRRAAAGTSFALQRCEEGVWYSESVKNEMARKLPNEKPVTTHDAPDDTTAVLADTFNTYQTQLFITSGHATQRDWQIGYAYPNGQFRCENGRLYGLDLAKEKHPIESPNPKVYLPVGNCLMGNIDSRDAMALAFMNSGGVNQMVGYTVPTWYGYGGWGVLDYFLEQPGRFSLSEAFYANQQALIYRLERYFPDVLRQIREHGDSSEPIQLKIDQTPELDAAGLAPQDCVGLLYDMDTVAFYGDPAWDARLAPPTEPLGWAQTLTEQDGEFTLTIHTQNGEKSFAPVNTNGSQRGGRPIFVVLPHRIDPTTVQLLDGESLEPVITENFILVPQPTPDAQTTVYTLRFTATHP